MYNPDDFGRALVDKVTVEAFFKHLSAEERDILVLWLWEELPFDDIGQVIGERYRGRALTGSVIRYHRDRILIRLREIMRDVEVKG